MAASAPSKLTEEELKNCARVLDQARLEGREMERLSLRHPDLTVSEAYRVQEEGIAFRQKQGERVIGFKMGLTSRAKREQMNLDSPVYGVLTDRMKVEETFSLRGTIHPKIEPEIAFVLGRELQGEVSAEEALLACSGIAPAMEILDSRYLGFKYFSLPDVVADNSSSAWFVMGKTRAPADFKLEELAQLAMRMDVNGEQAQEALSGEISGNPVHSLVQLCALLHQRGQKVPAGSVVLAGAATPAVQLEVGQRVRLEVASLGDVEIRVG